MAANPTDFDWLHPDYAAVFAARVTRLRRLQADSRALAAVKAYYREHPEAFICDWGCVQEPRNAALGLPTTIPFLLWPRQRELVQWILERWRRGESGVVTKSRDSGVSWLTTALACTLCLFNEGVVVGMASRKVEYCDGTPKSLLAKARSFLRNLPPEFLGGWDADKHAPFMRIHFPATGSAITAEGGGQIGRGDRTSMTVVDESAFLDDPESVDAALSQTTRCRIDVSTPHGRTNPFAQKHFGGKVPRFVFSWRDCPLKDDAWYARQVATLPPHVLAQEVDGDFSASVEGIVIPLLWAQATVDADKKLGITVTGQKYAGFDIADTGDRCAIALRRGIRVAHLESWSGAGSDLFASTVRAFNILDAHGWDNFHFDNDGLGASITGDALQINEARRAAQRPLIRAESYRGSGAVYDPEGELVTGRENQDYFLNMKAMAWWWVRMKVEATFRAVVLGRRPFDPEALISLPGDLPELGELLIELSQPTFTLNQTGKLVIDKNAGGRSPDRADAVVIAFEPGTQWAELWTRLGSRK